MASFIILLPNIGNEALLKEEVRAKCRDFKPSFGRPGILTYKSEKELTLLELDKISLIFSRRVMLSIGKLSTPEALFEKKWAYQFRRFHHISLDPNQNGPNRLGPIWNERAEVGDLVATVITLSPSEHWVAVHRQREFELKSPGGISSIVLPPESPSRAYLKMAETFLETEFCPKPEAHFLDIGSAPGGVTYFLLSKGMKVTAIDAGEMDSELLTNPNLHFIKKSVQEVKREQIKSSVDYIVVDLNLSPMISLHETLRLAEYHRDTLKALFITLKIPDAKLLRQIPGMFTRVKDFGAKDSIGMQLHAHKKEFLMIAKP